MAAPKHRTLSWHVYNDLVHLISSGRYPAGSRLDEQQIAVELGVSRTPLREAISKLVKDGLIEHRPYRGNFLRLFTAKEVFDLYEVRKALESLSVRLAMSRLSGAAVAELKEILSEIDGALKAGDLEAYGLADQRFHGAIAELSGNETLITTLEKLSGQVQVIRAMANQDPDVVEITALERPGIVAAMNDGDIEKATSLMEEHIELVQRSATERMSAPQLAVLDNAGDRGPT